jgi:PAP_fibrillin
MTKAALLALLADKNRGLTASSTEKQAIAAAIAQLETLNPTPNPLQRPDLLAGDWRLIYTSSMSLLNIDRLPLSELGNIYQSVRPDLQRIYNIAEIRSLPYLSSLVSIVANFQPVSTIRVKVEFCRSIAGLQSLVSYTTPADWIDRLESSQKLLAIDFPIRNPNADSWLDVTYLDDDLRIGRGNQGSLFVLTK